MSSEAGPSSAPLFKKRGKQHATSSRISSAAINEPTPASTSLNSADASTTLPDAAARQRSDNDNDNDNDDDDEDDNVSVQDLIALRSLTRKPTGIELQRLNQGDKKKTKKKQQQQQQQQQQQSSTDKSAAQLQDERWEQQMQRGGLMATADDDDSDQEDGSKPRRLVRKNNFQAETGTVDVDKHMMAYIEQEMQRRTGTTSTSLSSSDVLRAVNNPEDELYAVAEKYQQLQRSLQPAQTQEQREGNVALSAAMLSAIPEVDLGIDTRMKNIQETERAKRHFFEQAKGSTAPAHLAPDQAFANARFQRQTPRAIQSDAQHGAAKGERKQMATDQLVLDRFKKRQRNFR